MPDVKLPGLPVLSTTRLRLRPFTLEDAPRVHELLSDGVIARTVVAVPYPYPEGAAEQWIASREEACRMGTSIDLAVERPGDARLVGTVMLAVEGRHARAELGYWIGPAFWGNGFATEAARRMLAYGFETLRLRRIFAYHLADNPASGRVLEKLGLVREGCRRQHTFLDGRFRDSVAYGVLRAEYEGASGGREVPPCPDAALPASPSVTPATEIPGRET